jgi:integrase
MEALKLTWDRVDLERGLIYLVDTKNKESRMLPIGGHTLELISELSIGKPAWSKYVFLSRYGSHYTDITYPWKIALREAGIQSFRWHDIRHTTASMLAMQGVPLLSIGQLLGHKSYEVTRRYAHLSTNHLRGMLAGLNDMMFPDL